MELHYRSYGSGPPLIILHGLFGSLNNWHSHATLLGEQFQVFTIDQRNHGASPHSPVMSYEAMANDILEFITRHHIAPVHLLGHSMGGKTAMEFALGHGQEVRKLIVVDIRPQGDPPQHHRILDALRSIDFESIQSRADVDRALIPGIPDMAERQFVETNLKRQDDGSFRWKMNLRAISDNYEELIGPLTVDRQFAGPALFVSGGRSSCIKEDDRTGILRLFPHAEFVEIPRAGHWVHADAPDDFRKVIVEFLS